MIPEDTAIVVDNIKKCYRIWQKEDRHENLVTAMCGFIKSPLSNYRKYRSLYVFDDIEDCEDTDDVLWALKGVSFELKGGQVLGIIGRNGAGKSTLLKILSKITDPSDGYAAIRGRVSSLLEVGTGFHPELSGRENIYLNGTVLGMKKREVDQKFDEIVDFSGIDKFIDTPVKRYSSGMKVRLAFSVAAHLEPEILVIDEVLAVGDADFQKKCLNKMHDVGQQGRTVLFVSHNLPAVTRICDRAILLEGGKVVEDGPSGAVVSTYLCSGHGTTAKREWPNPATAPAGPLSRLRAVRVLNDCGEIAETIDIRRSFCLEMEYEVLEEGHYLMPFMSILNEHGDIVFVTHDQDPTWRGCKRKRGRYLSRVVVPGNFMAEGLFLVNCFLRRLNPDVRQFSEYSAVAFNVVDSLDGDSARGDWAKNMEGVVRPLLDWNTELLEKGEVVSFETPLTKCSDLRN